MQLTMPPKDATTSILERAQTANVSGQILIIAGNKRSIESYGFSDIPATVKLGKYPAAPTVY